MRITHLLALVGTLVLTGCSSMMKPADNQVIEASPQDSTQVVFMRSAFMAKAIDASVYDVTGGKTRFIGILSNGTKVAYPTTPGHHTFMVVSEAADFMDADLAPGKTYYSMVIPRMGMWKARFSPWPVARDPKAEYSSQSSDFKGWIADTKLVINSPQSLNWFESNKASVESKRVEYWSDWQKKSAADIELRTLHAADGL